MTGKFNGSMLLPDFIQEVFIAAEIAFMRIEDDHQGFFR